jgi:hypothetical protein
MAVGPHIVAHGSAEEFREWQVRDLADDVPEGEVDPGDGGGTHDAVAVPEMLAIHHLPEMLDPGRILADEERGKVLDRPDDAAGVPLERRFAPADETGLIGHDLDEDPVPHSRVADEGFDGGDFHAARSEAMESMSCSSEPAATTAMLSW